MELAKYIDHTALKADTGRAAIEKLCQEAREYGFMSVCVNPTWVATAQSLLAGSDVKVCTVIGFPLGANTSAVKAFETRTAIKEAGADFVKTSTGFSTGGATVQDIHLMREAVGPDMGVKASGGVQNRADALAMIEAGASRIGASKGIAIVTGQATSNAPGSY